LQGLAFRCIAPQAKRERSAKSFQQKILIPAVRQWTKQYFQSDARASAYAHLLRAANETKLQNSRLYFQGIRAIPICIEGRASS
jgi:hypothetical protein